MNCFWEVYKSIPQVNTVQQIMSQTVADKEEQFLKVLANGGLMKINTSMEPICSNQAKL